MDPTIALSVPGRTPDPMARREERPPSPAAVAELDAAVRDYVGRLLERLSGRLASERPDPPGLLEARPWSGEEPSVGSADGGSAIYPLVSASFGVFLAVGILIPGDGRVRRTAVRRGVIPEDPDRAAGFTEDEVDAVLRPAREAAVMSAAEEVVRGALGGKPDLLILDGPLIPPASLWLKIRGVSHAADARSALNSYLEARRGLVDAAREEGVSLVGFVKRPQSRYLRVVLGLEDGLTDAALSIPWLRDAGLASPWPPATLGRRELDAILGDGEVRGSVEPGEVSITMVRTSRSRPPYRLDLGPLSGRFSDPAALVSYLSSRSNALGIPLAVAKADESIKVGRRIADDAYRGAVASRLAADLRAGQAADLLERLYGW